MSVKEQITTLLAGTDIVTGGYHRVQDNRHALNQFLYTKLLVWYPEKPELRLYLLPDGTDKEWLASIKGHILPHLREANNG
jgi:hypothetical protein